MTPTNWKEFMQWKWNRKRRHLIERKTEKTPTLSSRMAPILARPPALPGKIHWEQKNSWWASCFSSKGLLKPEVLPIIHLEKYLTSVVEDHLLCKYPRDFVRRLDARRRYSGRDSTLQFVTNFRLEESVWRGNENCSQSGRKLYRVLRKNSLTKCESLPHEIQPVFHSRRSVTMSLQCGCNPEITRLRTG